MRFLYLSFYIGFKMRLPNITSLQKTKNVTHSKSYIFLIASNQQNIITIREKVLEEIKSAP